MGEPRDRMPFPEMQRPIFISGKVVVDDGTPPPDSVVIERVCNGQPRPEAYTDSKGRFSFQLGQNQHIMADASVSSASEPGFGPPMAGSSRGGGGFGGSRGISERDLIGCELRASLPGFRSEVVNLSGRRVMDNPDVGTIILRRLGKVEGFTFSATSALAPKDARKAYEKGLDQAKKNKPAEAQREYEKAVQLYPKYAIAWYELGVLYDKQKNAEQARKAFGEALNADAKFTKPYLQLAEISARENKWQDVADTTGRLLRLNPFDPTAYFFNSWANLQMQKLDEAEKSAREGLKSDAENRLPRLNHLLGVILAQKQDFSGAADSMRTYLKLAPNASNADFVKKQLAEVEKFAATTKPAGQQP
jgi:tetratricopeptide (TPR) repeat protein